MSSPIQTLKIRIAEKSTGIPKGELWLGRGIFQASNLDDTMDNHFVLAERLGHAVVCLPVTYEGASKPDLGYRYFSVTDIQKAMKREGMPVFAVVDGPFQELVNTMGLMKALTTWASRRNDMITAYNTHGKRCVDLISRILEHPPAAVVFTDDMAFANGPLGSPKDMDALCSPFYIRAVKLLKECGVPVFLHSCGNITKLIPVFQSWQLDGFAAIQSGLNDLENLYQAFDSEIMILAGIESELLETYPFPEESKQKFKRLLDGIGATGDLILGSSSGLYKPEYLEQIKRIYEFVVPYNSFSS